MADFIRVPFAVEGDQQSIPQELQTDGNVSMQTGYTYDYERDPSSDPSAKDIPRPETNWLYNLITTAIHQYQTEGTFPFITAALNAGKPFPYKKYARCTYEGDGMSGIFESLVDNNTSAPTDTTKWKKIVNAGEITVKTTAPLSGGGVLSDDVTIGLSGTLAIANGGTGNTAGLAASSTKLATARTLRTNLASTGAASFDGTANITPGVTGTLPIGNGGTGNTTGLAASATKLATARTVQTNLGSTAAATFNGTGNIAPGVTGTLPIANGGTSATSAANARTALGVGYTHSNASAGYYKFPGGTIIQWGALTSTKIGTVVTFPIAFPNAVRAIMLTDSNVTASDMSAVAIASAAPSTTKFTLAGPANPGRFHWLAIGY